MMTPFLVVLPVCHKDIHLAIANLKRCIELDGKCKFAALVCRETGFDTPEVFELLALCDKYFSHVGQFGYAPWKGDQKWPLPQNKAWQSIARFIEFDTAATGVKCWLWWEADADPLAPNWLGVLLENYIKGKLPFMGHFTAQGHMNGVAVYPRNISSYSQRAYIAHDAPFDIVLSRDIRIGRANCNATKANHLILHQFKHAGGDAPAVIGKDAPNYGEAVLFHGATHSTEAPKNVDTAPAQYLPFRDQTKWKSGMFLLPGASNIVYFNPSIIPYDGDLYLFARMCSRSHVKDGEKGYRQSSRLAIFGFKDPDSFSGLPHRMVIPNGPERWPEEQWEDPRCIRFKNKIYISMATWVPTELNTWKIRQSLVRLDTDWSAFKVYKEPNFGGNHSVPEMATGHEKNWVWFEHNGELHFVYQTNPLQIVALSGHQYNGELKQLKWDYGQPRGGTNPVQVGDEFISFFHSSSTWIAPKRRYYMGAVAFQARPPFAITRITTAPLLCGSENDPRFFGGPPCIFPGGAVLKDGVWTIVFGVNDENCGWIQIPQADIEERLQRV